MDNINTAQIIEALNISAATLARWRRLGMPCTVANACLTEKGRRYRYDLQAVMDWLAARNASAPSKATPEASAVTPTPCATAERKGVER